MPDRKSLEFEPSPGSTILLRPEGFDGEFKTYFIGMEPGQYVICSLGAMMCSVENISNVLSKNKRTKLFYVRQGVVKGFLVHILSYKTTPFRHLYVSYPKISQTFNLRTSDRVDCHLPAKISCDESKGQGMLTNISSGGCRLSMLSRNGEAGWLKEGERYNLSFQLNTQAKPLNCACILAKLMPREAVLHLGLSFEDMVERKQALVNDFITFVSEYRI
ncbi:MAG: PilZ domain-containing protein [Desulfovibrionaceae bacterium]